MANKIDNTKFAALANELKGQFFERNEQITGLMCALLAKEHIALIGEPGTAKSALSDELCKRITGAEYFQWLLSKFSTPEELYGPISLKALEEDKFRRVITDKLPEAHIAFLDEIWKANSSILNTLLTLINERKYHNNGHPIDCPLQTMVGASNEFPESSELGALYDRFIFRYMVNYIAEDGNFAEFMTGASVEQTSQATVFITLDELGEAQEAVKQVTIPADIITLLVKIRQNMREAGIIASDRRYKKMLKILKAHAWFNGRDVVTEDDTEIMEHMLWDTPDQIKTVRNVIVTTAQPLMSKVNAALDVAEDVYNACMGAIRENPDITTEAGIEATTKLRKQAEAINEVLESAKAQKKDISKIEEAFDKVSAYNDDVCAKCIGITSIKKA